MEDAAVQRKLEVLWEHATGVIKKQIVNPTLWKAMEAAKPLAVEGDLLIIAISPQDYHFASNMDKPGPRNAIAEVLSAAARRPVNFRIIEGETLEDWEQIKEGERTLKQPPELPVQPVAEKTSVMAEAEVDSWEKLTTYMHSAYSRLHGKNTPQSRARFIVGMVPVIASVEDHVGPRMDQHTEERALTHVIDKVAQMTETDPIVVALEYYRYRRDHLLDEERATGAGSRGE